MNTRSSSLIPGIAGLRFIAAAAVIVGHVELMLKLFRVKGVWKDMNAMYTDVPLKHIAQGQIHWISPLISNLGYHAVIFFFVLSGFLITHVLLQEKVKTGQIKIGRFYLLRFLRIGPLYFLLLAFAFLVGAVEWSSFSLYTQLPWKEDYAGVVASYVMLSPNVGLLFFPFIGMLGHLWSIGVEEHFYAMWPWFIKHGKVTVRWMIGVAIAWFMFKVLAEGLRVVLAWEWLEWVVRYGVINKFECMAMGGAAAIVYRRRSSLPTAWFGPKALSRAGWFTAGLFVLSLYVLPEKWASFNYWGLALFTVLLILYVSQYSSHSWLESKAMQTAGNMSYAMYIFHLPLVIFWVHWFTDSIPDGPNRPLSAWHHAGLYGAVFVSVLVVSWLAFQFIELPLQRKRQSMRAAG